MIASLGMKLTPMMEQWHKAKAAHPDAILLFRMGDFYELFGQDAITAAPILDLTLTSRDKDKSGLRMAGFPFHAADSYVSRLIEEGHKVAICEQLEDPKLSRGIVKRGITNVITPGTAIDTETKDQGELSFLISIACSQSDIALCALDLGTATFKVTSSTSEEKILDEAIRIAPKELVVLRDDRKALGISERLARELMRRNPLRIEKREALSERLGKSFVAEITLKEAEANAADLVLAYLSELKGNLPKHLDCPKRYSIDAQLLMDEATRANLDLFPKKKGDRHNLFSVLDAMKTVMGKRALHQAIRAPSTERQEIEFRHNIVDELFNLRDLCVAIREALSACYDLEKLTALLASGRISPRGLAQLRNSLASIFQINSVVNSSMAHRTKSFLASAPDMEAMRAEITEALVEEPPVNLRDGGVFRKGHDSELDDLRNLITNGKEMLLALEAKERKDSGIPSLKIRFTRVLAIISKLQKPIWKKSLSIISENKPSRTASGTSLRN